MIVRLRPPTWVFRWNAESSEAEIVSTHTGRTEGKLTRLSMQVPGEARS